MNLNSNDYKSMICARVDWVRMSLYPNQYGGVNAPQAINNNAVAPVEAPPDFARIKELIAEIGELTDAFETSIGPA